MTAAIIIVAAIAMAFGVWLWRVPYGRDNCWRGEGGYKPMTARQRWAFRRDMCGFIILSLLTLVLHPFACVADWFTSPCALASAPPVFCTSCDPWGCIWGILRMPDGVYRCSGCGAVIHKRSDDSCGAGEA